MGCEFIISSISIFVFASLDQILWFRSNLNYLPNLRASPCAMCIVIPHYRIKGASDQLSDQGASRLAPGTLQHSAALCSGLQCCIITRDCSSAPGSPPATVTAAAWREASRGGGGCLTPRLARVRNGERRDTVALSWLSTLPHRGVTRDGEHSHLETSTPPHVTCDSLSRAPRYVTSHCGSQLSCHDPRLVWAAQNMRVRWRQWNYRACSKLDVWRKAAGCPSQVEMFKMIIWRQCRGAAWAGNEQTNNLHPLLYNDLSWHEELIL